MIDVTLVPDLPGVAERVKNLERHNRRLNYILWTLLAATGVLFCMGQAERTPQAITAQNFVLQDSQGRVRAELSMARASGQDSAKLTLTDAKGTVRGELDESGLALYDPNGKLRAKLSIQQSRWQDTANLSFGDANGRVRVEIDESTWKLLGPSGIPPIPFFMVSLDDAHNPGAHVGIIDAHGSVGFGTRSGEAFVNIQDEHGSTQVNGSRVMISGTDRKPIWQAPQSSH